MLLLPLMRPTAEQEGWREPV